MAVTNRYGTELVSPLAAFLASPACTVTGEAFSALGGRYSRVFYGVTRGWFSPTDAPVTPGDIAEHADEIMAIDDGVLVPEKIRDEYEAVAALFTGERRRVGAPEHQAVRSDVVVVHGRRWPRRSFRSLLRPAHHLVR